MMAADFWFDRKDYKRAIELYQQGLSKEIATVQEREHMEKNLQHCQQKIK
jgi:isopenicillin-N N-acyltransferase-like protein